MVDTTQILDIVKLIVSKINWVLMLLATQIATLAKLDVNNVYLILIIISALYISRKFMLLIYASGEEGRTTTWLAIAGGIFGVLYFLK